MSRVTLNQQMVAVFEKVVYSERLQVQPVWIPAYLIQLGSLKFMVSNSLNFLGLSLVHFKFTKQTSGKFNLVVSRLLVTAVQRSLRRLKFGSSVT